MARTYYGKYRAKVIDNQDPEKMGRIKVYCPKVLGDYESNWAVPSVPYAFDKGGSIRIPREDEIVWVEFEGGDPEKPIVVGQWWIPENTPIESGEYEKIDRIRRIKTESGHKITFYDEDGKEYIEVISSSGHRVKLGDEEGQNKIEIEDNKGNKIELDTESNNMNVNVNNDESRTIGNNKTEEISSNLTINAGSAVTVNASSVTVTASTVTVNGGTTTVNGTVHLAGGGKPVARVDDAIEVYVSGGSSAGTHPGKIIAGSGKCDSG